jgi:hypothetical protein
VLKKKRECEKEEEEGLPIRGCPISHIWCHHWRTAIRRGMVRSICIWRTPMRLTTYSVPGASPKLACFTGFRYKKKIGSKKF